MKKIKKSLIVVSVAFSFIGNSQTFTLPKLKYAYNSLESSIDSSTMLIHHSKHHQTYITNLNKAILGTKADSIGLTELLLTTSSRTEAIRNNAGGHFNHSLFWEILTPKKDTKPSAELMKAIESTFTSLDSLKKVINKAGSSRFGSGWAWLIVSPDNKLLVSSTPNQDNPLMDITKDRGIPILAIDVWEHAYYLKYQNKRADYLGAIWNIIDWEEISKKYSNALNDPLLKKLK
jgi:Fe-Mn family superoxide dismutase